MITRVQLRNYTSFGAQVTADLQPITVLIGPNNSGKTNFLKFADLLQSLPADVSPLFHRPSRGDGQMVIGWETLFFDQQGNKHVDRFDVQLSTGSFDGDTQGIREVISLDIANGPAQVYTRSSSSQKKSGSADYDHSGVGAALGVSAFTLADRYPDYSSTPRVRHLMNPVRFARSAHLHVEALRSDAQITPNPRLAKDGSNLAAVLAHWLLEAPERAVRFNTIIPSCLPEMKRVHVTSPRDGMVRLHFEQNDGQRFDATRVSDGVLVFAGLIAHALDAPPGALLMIEEPERGVHPRRIKELVDLLRTLVQEQDTQFILATHSPALLNHFRDEPEAILTFKRSPTGSAITRLTDKQDWVDMLANADPAELLMGGVFNEGT